MKVKKKDKFSYFTYLKPYRKHLILAVSTILIECGLEISLPFLMNLLLQNGMTMDFSGSETKYTLNLTYTLIMGGVMVGLAVISFILGMITAKSTAKAGRGLGFELRKQEYRKIQEFTFSNLDDFRINSLITRMTNDIQIISDSFCQMLRPILRAPLQLVFATAFALMMSQELSLVFAITVPLLGLILIGIVVRARPKFYELQTALDHINRTTQESLIAEKLVRANSKMDYEKAKFDNVNMESRKIGNHALGLTALNMGFMQLMTYACIVAVLYTGGKTAIIKAQDAQAVSNIATFLSYVNQMMASLNMLSNVFMIFTRSEASKKRVQEVFQAQPEIKDNKDSTLKMETGTIKFDHVYFKYKESSEEYVIKDNDFEIEDGQFIGILGQTGSGKSTLVYLLERFYDVSKGKILIGGHDIKDYSLDEVRKNIAISFQNPTLFTGTIKENLLWGKEDATDEEVIEACKIACCHDFIMEKLPNGYDTQLGQTGSNVSGGQRQRLCIARALIRKPKILILDDSFSALDRITEGQLKSNLKTMLPKMTKIIISQKVSTIQDADRIIVLNEGSVNSIGDSKTLLEKDAIYQDIYHIQMEGK
jgi:ATP-binding cassette, subfamily B, multidrug efflux pump